MAPLHVHNSTQPTAASTLQVCEDSTFNRICIDMDILDAPGLIKSTKCVKLFMHHAHYVAPSHVTSLGG